MNTIVNLDEALLDPASVFEKPEEVRDHTELTKAQKIEILRRWEYEESEVAVAEEEGMVDGSPPILRRVLIALEELGAHIDTEHSPPTKLNGI
ncbi:MAG: hypothetical protein KJO09_03145 [Gammaproteobacteria bacterium]|nr:hypothetical protein [Gammaproteobacteria bacterium]